MIKLTPKIKTIVSALSTNKLQYRSVAKSIYEKLECDIIEPRNPELHNSTLIWLHGIGQDSQTFHTLLKQIAPPSTRCVLPNAQERFVTVQHVNTRAWYDVRTYDRMGDVKDPANPTKTLEDTEGIEDARNLIKRLVDAELDFIKHHLQLEFQKKQLFEVGDIHFTQPPVVPRLILGGYDIGGALALLTGLTYPNQMLRGLIATSAYVPHRQNLHDNFCSIQREAQVEAFHGKRDDIVNYSFAMEGYRDLKHTFLMPNIFVNIDDTRAHEIDMPEVERMTDVLDQWCRNLPRIHDKDYFAEKQTKTL
jgi:predicted esterase